MEPSEPERATEAREARRSGELLRNVLLKGCKKGCPAGFDLSQFETKEDFYVKQPDPNKISP